MALLDDARTYIGSNFGPTYTAWMALGDTDATKTLVTATRFLDSFTWQGTATGVVGSLPTSLQWPRTGVYVNGVQLDPTVVPAAIVQATFELAVMILADPGLIAQADAGSNVAELGAGPARIRFFRPSSPGDGNATRLPPQIDRLIGRFLAGAGMAFTGMATGINPVSNFQPCGCSVSPCGCDGQRRDVRWPL